MKVKNIDNIVNRTHDIQTEIDSLFENWQLVIEDRDADTLDVASLLFSLYKRRSQVNIPSYKVSGNINTDVNETIVSRFNRNGQIQKLISNKNTFSFSIQVKDENVINTETGEVGAPRRFKLVDDDGTWYQGFDILSFIPDSKESEVISNIKGDKAFNSFVHRNRWLSVYGSSYATAKAIIVRLQDRADFLKNEIKRIEGIIEIPSVEKEYVSYDKKDTETVKVESIEFEIDLPEFVGEYKPLEVSIKGYNEAKKERNHIIYSVIPDIQFLTRIAEYAFYQFGIKGGQEHYPSWIKNTWERGFKFPRKRIEWNRLEGEDGVALRYRVVERSVSKVVA